MAVDIAYRAAHPVAQGPGPNAAVSGSQITRVHREHPPPARVSLDAGPDSSGVETLRRAGLAGHVYNIASPHQLLSTSRLVL